MPLRTSSVALRAVSQLPSVINELFSHSLSGNLAYIKANFGVISSIINCLEAVGAQLHKSSEIMQGDKCQARQAHGNVSDTVKSKLKNLLF